MGLINGLLRGVATAGVAALVARTVKDHGGLDGMMETLKQKGLAGAVGSWLGPGENQAVTPNQMRDALGQDHLDAIGRDQGMSGDEVAQQLSQNLPNVVNHLSPDGRLPQEDPFRDADDAAVRRMVE
jgi:uncharacterized protein YidB (DUF937 family)